MLFRYKKVFLNLLVISSAILASCSGGQSESEALVIEEAGAAPSIGQAVSGLPIDLAENEAPRINSISMGCDILLESIAIKVGETTTFTLNVTDESPLTLQYSISSDDPSLLATSVDSNGIINLLGVSEGTTTIPIRVTDEAGMQNEILVSVIVEA